MIYIYGLVCPVADVVRYVGKSVNPTARHKAHVLAAMRGDYNHRTARWIRKIVNAGQVPSLVILHEVTEGERWQDVERDFIARSAERGWKLTNSTAGGEGLDYIDPVASAKYRAKLSASMQEVWGTPERKLQARERARKFYSDPVASKAKAEAVRAAYRRPDVLARAVEVGREIGARPEVKAIKSQKSRAMWDDPERRAKVEAGFTVDVRQQMSQSAKARWADPVKSAADRAANSSPERRAKLSAAAERRATPEYRAMMAEKTRASWEKRRLKAQEI